MNNHVQESANNKQEPTNEKPTNKQDQGLTNEQNKESTSEQLTDEQELTSEFEFNEDELSDDGYDMQSLYVLEEKEGYRRFTLPLSSYYSWIVEEEKSKSINFVKKHGTYKNKKGSWSEYYLCSCMGSKQIRNDHEIISEIRKFAQQGLSISAIQQLMKALEETTEKYFVSNEVVPKRDELLTYEDIYNIIYKEIHMKYRYSGLEMNSMYGKQKFMLGFHMLWQFKLYEKYHEHPYSSQGVPLAWLLTESQDSETIKLWLHALKEDSWIDPVNVILDNDDTEISAIRKEHNDLFQDLNQLLSISDKSEVNNALIKFEQKWQHTAAIQYFNAQYRQKK
ncbi:569_t:CDS:2, partial [Dentiscutata heterogama]